MNKFFTLIFCTLFYVVGFAQVPPNNDCANAIQLNNLNNFCGQYLFGEPTFDIADGPCAPTFNPALNIWYRFTAVGATVTIGAAGGSNLYKITLIRFPFGPCGITEIIDCNSSVLTNTNLIIGEEYYVIISSGNTSANFELCVNNPLPNPPPNNDPCEAIVLGNNVPSCGTTVDATPTFPALGMPCPTIASNQVWYEVTVPPGQTNLEITLLASTLSGGAQVIVGQWTSGCTGTFQYNEAHVYCGPAINTFEFSCMDPGTYYILLSSNNAGAGAFCITANAYGSPPGCGLNDACADATQVPSFVLNQAPVCVAGCNIGACGEDFTSAGCNYNGGVVWYSVTTPPGASVLNITLNSPDVSLSDPQIQLFSGDCNNLSAVTGCNIGGNGNLNLLGLEVTQNTTYLVAVGNNSGGTGTFNICFSASDPTTVCTLSSGVTVTGTSLGSPPSGPYLPGEQVSFSYSMQFTSANNGIQWPHGIVPVAGPCWNMASLSFEDAQTQGNWTWFEEGIVSYNSTNPFVRLYYGPDGDARLCFWIDPTCAGAPLAVGDLMPAGWWWINQPGQCAGDLGDPNNTWGQPCGVCGTTINFTLTTKSFEECDGNPAVLDCGLQFYVFSDFQTGCWLTGGDNTCGADFPAFFQASLNCCRGPIVVEDMDRICSGEATNFEITSDQDAEGASYTWTVNSPGGVSGAAPGEGKFIRQTLVNNTTSVQTVEYIVSGLSGTGCPGLPTSITVEVLPVIVIDITTFPEEGCATTPFDVIANVTGGNGGPYEYLWSYQQSTDMSLLGITPGQEGIFPYSVTVTDGDGCTATASAVVEVSPKVDVDFQMDTTTFCAQDGPVQLNVVTDATVAPGGYAWTVPFGAQPNTNAGSISIPSNPNQIFSTNSGLFQLTITDINGCTGDTEIEVSVYPTPRFLFNGFPPDEICVNDDIIMSGEEVDYNDFWFVDAESSSEFIWSGTGLPIGGKVYPADLLILSGPGTYTVKLLVVSPYNCRDSLEHTFELLVPQALTLTEPAPFCATGDPYTLTGVPAGGTWSGPGVNNGIFDPKLLTPNTYTLYYEYVQGLCVSRDSMEVVIDEAPVMTLDPVTPKCFDAAPVQLNATPAGGTWTSLTPGLLDPNNIFDPQNVSSAGTYQFVYTVTENGCDFSDTLDIQVYPELRADFQLTSPVCLTNTSTIQFNGVAPAGTNYVWNVANGTITNNNNNGQITVQWNSEGTHNITLSIDINGCSNGPITKTITVERPLDDPQPVCGLLTTTSVAFDWANIAGSTGYIVNYAGTDYPQTNSDFSVTGLTPPGQVTPITITVTAVGNGICGNSNPVTVVCSSTPCPSVSLTPASPVLSFCIDPAAPPIQVVMNKTGGDNSGTGVWSGPFVTPAGAFNPVAAGAGQFTLTYTYTEASCVFTESMVVNLYAPSVPSWTADKQLVCVDEVVTITYNGDNKNAGTLVWNVDGGSILAGSTDQVLLISWATGGTKNISVFVEDDFCTSQTFTASIEVEEPLPIPVVTCGANPVSVTFNWDPIPGVTQYLISIDGGPFTPTNLTTHQITGLNQGDPAITIQVIAVGNGPCGNSGIGTASCAPKPCEPIDVTINPVSSICLTASAAAVQLVANAAGSDGSGTYSWSGPGITNPATGTFDPKVAGVGTHLIEARFNEDFCNYFANITIVVLEVPTASFTISGPICTDEIVSANYTGNAGAGATYSWTVNGGSIIGSSTGPNIDIQWATGGVKTVTLSVAQNGCTSDPESRDITVEVPLAAPVVICNSSTTEVEFTWGPVAGATGYIVTTNPGTTFTTTDLSALISGLTVGQVVTISVTAVAPVGYSCGNSATTDLTCEAEQCPGIFVDISPVSFICLRSNTPIVSLDVDVTGQVVSGTGQWIGGAGLIDNQIGTFDPKVAGVGNHEIVYAYREKACNYYDTIYIDVRPQPLAEFTATSPLCVDEVGSVQFTGTATGAGTYNWSLDGATVISGSGTANLEVSWATNGTKNLELIVSDNGCISDPVTHTVRVDRRLAAPIISCNSTLTSITFSWNNVGTEGYLVSLDGAPPTFVSSNVLDLQNLTTGDSVTITVVAIDSGPCGNSPEGELTCYAVNCADVVLSISPQPVLCMTEAGNTVKLTAAATGGYGGGTYTWSGPGIVDQANGLFDPFIAGAGDHEIFLTYRESVCPYQESIIITVTEGPELLTDVKDASCFGYSDGSIIIEDASGGTPPYTYSLNGSASSSQLSFANLKQGSYVLEVKDANGCTQEYTLLVRHPDRLTVDLGPDILMETGDTVELSPILNIASNDSTSYWWTGDESIDCATCPIVNISPADQTVINVEVTDSVGCKGSDAISITVKKKRRVFIPAAFSPNGDGINDMFFVFGGIEVARIESMKIFNRWGNEVFVNEDFPPNESSEGWNGLHRGEVLNPAVFVYSVVVRFTDGSRENFYGDVSLMRAEKN
jgi:gliding motility-associated-like protein